MANCFVAHLKSLCGVEVPRAPRISSILKSSGFIDGMANFFVALLRLRWGCVFVVSAAVGLGACTKKSSEPQGPAVPLTTEQLVAKGQSVYRMQCISCHNINPRLDGSIGPKVWGSSRELLEAKILGGNYPAGYEPLRKTSVMPKMPHLKNEIDSLHQYLQQPE